MVHLAGPTDKAVTTEALKHNANASKFKGCEGTSKNNNWRMPVTSQDITIVLEPRESIAEAKKLYIRARTTGMLRIQNSVTASSTDSEQGLDTFIPESINLSSQNSDDILVGGLPNVGHPSWDRNVMDVGLFKFFAVLIGPMRPMCIIGTARLAATLLVYWESSCCCLLRKRKESKSKGLLTSEMGLSSLTFSSPTSHRTCSPTLA